MSFYYDIFTAMNLLNKSLINSETRIACQTVCLCPFLCDVSAYNLHRGLLCCMGMLQSLRERSKNVSFLTDTKREKKIISSSQQGDLTITKDYKNKICDVIIFTVFAIFYKQRPDHWKA